MQGAVACTSSVRASGAGLRVLVTRPVEQAAHWVAALQAEGIDAVALPLLEIAPPADPAPVEAAWQAIAEYALLVFVSPNAATRFFACRPAGHAWPTTLQVASPGPGTSDTLRALGVPAVQLIEPAADAAQFDSESLWQQLGRHPWSGRRVLIVRGEGGREWLAGQLEAAGADVGFVAAYRRGPPQFDAAGCAALRHALDEPGAHFWLLSSSESIDHLPSLAAVEGAASDAAAFELALQRSTAVATHPRIAERALAAGFGRVLPCRPELAAVVACIQSEAVPKPLGEPHART
jgi:uroporphyrinogen-III synthase